MSRGEQSPTRSLRTVARALVRPVSTVREHRVPFQHVVAVVLVVAVLNGVGMALAASAMGEHVDSSMTVENPDRPQERLCQDPDSYPFEDRRDEIREECANEPRTVQVALGPVAQQAFTSRAFGLPFLTLLVWGVGTALVSSILAVGGRSTAPSLAETATVTGIATVPGSVRYALRPVLVEDAIAGMAFGPSREAVVTTLHGVVTGANADVVLAVTVATLVWQAAVLVGGLVAFEAVSLRTAGLAASPLVVLAYAHLPPSGEFAPFGVGAVFLVLVGLPGALFPRGFAEFDLRLDAIGARNRHELEAADWYVALTRYGGLAFALVGLFLLGGVAYVL